MKIVFAGSPEYALTVLKALDECEQVVGVITQPDRPVGRKKILTPTPVKAYALARGIKVLDCEKISSHTQEVKELGGEIMITCAYGQILSREILEIFKGGVWNLHASLLPELRGASPIQSAILGGQTHTGVTVMRTEEGLDCGDILLVKRTEIGNLTYGELSEKLSTLSALAAVEAVQILKLGNPQLLVQDEARATYCRKIRKEDAKADFSAPAERVKNTINGYSPSPAAFAYIGGAQVNLLKAEICPFEVLADLEKEQLPPDYAAGTVVAADKRRGIVIKCGEGYIRLLAAQFAGGKPLSWQDIVNGRKISAGEKLD